MNALAALQFPGLNPIAFHIGPFGVHWYGIAYLAGFALCYAALRLMIRRGLFRISPEALGDLLTWLVLGVMLGGRAGWWLFYHRAEGQPEPWYEPIAIWHGGMSFHGGLIGVGTAMVLWSRKYRVSFWHLADCVAMVTPLGLFFGRLANFVNAELVGRVTDVPWAVVFPGETVARHPSQLYEAALEGPTLMLLLWATPLRLPVREGQVAAAFLIFYGVFRIIAELFRQPDEQLGFIAFGWLTMGQLLSAIITTVGVALLAWRHRGRLAGGEAASAPEGPA